MAEYLDVTGSSGTHYRYAGEQLQLSPMGGNYVLIRDLPDGGWEMICAGETENLSRGAPVRKGQATADHGPNVKLYTRLNISSAVRRSELQDIIEAYQPVMNLAES